MSPSVIATMAILLAIGLAACGSGAKASARKPASASGGGTYSGVTVSPDPHSAGASARVSGTWAGTMTPSDGSNAQRHFVRVSDDRAEETGTFYLSATCQGTLKLKDISHGFHHFTEIPSKGSTCRGGGEDCLKPYGKQVLDVYVSPPGTKDNSSGILNRA